MGWLKHYLTDPSWRLACVSNSALITVWGTLGLIAYWGLVDTAPPIVNVRGEVSGRNDRTAWVEWHGRVVRSCPGRVHGWIVNGHLVSLPPQEFPYYPANARGTEVKQWFRVDIPSEMMTPAQHRVQYEFWCNPVQRVFSPLLVTPEPVPVYGGEQGGL